VVDPQSPRNRGVLQHSSGIQEMAHSKLYEKMSLEDREREYRWAVELYECRLRFIARCNSALFFHRDPKARRAHYEDWRKKYGDDIARESAKFVEACLKGTVSLDSMKRMTTRKPDRKDFFLDNEEAVLSSPAEKGARGNADLFER
jgi:hypothetical protein